MGTLDSFIPAMWSGNILQSLNNALVYGQRGVVNRDYEGQIRQFGDRVKINSISRVTVQTYAKNTDLADPENLTPGQQELIIDQGNYYNFQVDDLDRVQMNVELMGQATMDSGYELASTADANIAAHMVDNVPSANQIGSEASPKTDLGTATQAYVYLTQLATKLDNSNTPLNGRWVVVPPWFKEKMLQDDRFVKSGVQAGEIRLMNGTVAQAAGFTILMSNAVPKTTATTKFKIIAGHAIATSVADQVIETEAYRMEKRFGTGVKGLHVFGRKVVRPNNLAMLVANSA